MKSDPLITYRRKPATLDADKPRIFRRSSARPCRARTRVSLPHHERRRTAVAERPIPRQGLPHRRPVVSLSDGAASLGDIAISLERARAQAREWQTLRRRRNPHPHAARRPASARAWTTKPTPARMKRSRNTLAQETRAARRPDRAGGAMILAVLIVLLALVMLFTSDPDALPRKHAAAHARSALAAVFQIRPRAASQSALRRRRADVLALEAHLSGAVRRHCACPGDRRRNSHASPCCSRA